MSTNHSYALRGPSCLPALLRKPICASGGASLTLTRALRHTYNEHQKREGVGTVPDLDYTEFQKTVSQYLIRHRSVIDVTSKLQEATARVNRAIAKSVTSCGCVKINASRQCCPANITYGELKEFMQNHLEGQLCEDCRGVVETEIGNTLFYLAALCELFGLRLSDVVSDEHGRISTLGPYSLT